MFVVTSIMTCGSLNIRVYSKEYYFIPRYIFFRSTLNETNNKKELNELKCMERKMLKQTELIKSALNELGCEEVPSALDISIDNQTFIGNSGEQVK